MSKLTFDELARKDLKKLSPDIRRRIIAKLEFYSLAPNPLDFADTLTHREAGRYRFRIGAYRAIFDIEDDTIVILTLRHRREVYR